MYLIFFGKTETIQKLDLLLESHIKTKTKSFGETKITLPIMCRGDIKPHYTIYGEVMLVYSILAVVALACDY